MKLFRYRSPKMIYINILLDGYLSGTLFREFKDGSELNMFLSNNIANKYGFSLEQIDGMINKLRENDNQKYYLCCFSRVPGYYKNKMWKEFGGNYCGFCLVYDSADIKQAIWKSDNKIMFLKRVIYSKDKAPLDEIVDYLADPKRGLKYLENNDVDNAVLNCDKKAGNCIINTFLYKPLDKKDEDEYRLIVQSQETINSKYNNELLKVSPREILISDKMNFYMKYILIDYAKRNLIAYKIIDCS